MFLATVQTFPLEPKLPLASFKTFFLLARDATAFTDLGINVKVLRTVSDTFLSYSLGLSDSWFYNVRR